jgi:hypothetical protein
MMTLKRLDPHQSETQTWDRSGARNPPARGRAIATARQAEIRRGNGSKEDATHQDSGPWPAREEPKIW